MNSKNFVNAWLEAYSKRAGVPYVATRLGISVSTASARANYLRKQGVKLPQMPRKRAADYSVDELNELITSKI